ncbi:hypothetical protein TRFO_07683 [Tritrichomonas foetus]|uniref:Uncharacterized protein n=1 Tax=Tritrichomonas foetus TaxID=1144522 RepID=A0A1J4JPD2_9EUKA|nr:hypothetical protein TRFO_07683 [Tritrichomonas foetus]|eukprot:OHT01015.1 hypothetical protein TRFO_07683 [Tritrichomonas foetus]
MNFEYKTIDPSCKFQRNVFLSTIVMCLPDLYEDISQGESMLLQSSYFEECLNYGYSLFFNEQYFELSQLLIKLSDNFILDDDDYMYKINCFMNHPLSKILFQSVDTNHLYCLAPYILQLFINMSAAEKYSDTFIHYCIENRGVEITMHLKRQLTPQFLPLVFIFAFNIYRCCAYFLTQQTTEFYDILMWCPKTDERYRYLIPLQLLNILRSSPLDNPEVVNIFFKKIMKLSMQENDLAIYSMWCLYYYFRNSIKFCRQFITKKFMQFLVAKIRFSRNEKHIKIALYIYSYLFCFNDAIDIRFMCQKMFPLESVLELLTHPDKEIVVQAITLSNNFMAYQYPNVLVFIHAHGFDILVNIAQYDPVQCKIEAGIVLTHMMFMLESEELKNIMSEEFLIFLFDLIQIHDNDLTMSLLQFISSFLPRYNWIMNILISIDFDKELEEMESTLSNFALRDKAVRLFNSIQYHRKRMADEG